MIRLHLANHKYLLKTRQHSMRTDTKKQHVAAAQLEVHLQNESHKQEIKRLLFSKSMIN